MSKIVFEIVNDTDDMIVQLKSSLEYQIDIEPKEKLSFSSERDTLARFGHNGWNISLNFVSDIY